jgi:hypothetical protein
MKKLVGAAFLAAWLGVAAPAGAQAVAGAPAAAGDRLQFAPIAMAGLIEKMCRGAEKDGGDLIVLAKAAGLGEAHDPPYDLKRALPESAQVWPAPSADGALFLFGYGERPLKCGAAVLRPMPVIGFDLALAELQKDGFAIDSKETLNGSMRWMRLKAGGGQFVDLVEYPPEGSSPGVLRADLLVN